MFAQCLRTILRGYQTILSAPLLQFARSASLIALLCLSFSAISYAQSSNSSNTQKKPPVNQQQAIAKAKQSVPGKVLKVDRNKEHYRVKMLNQKGRVISVNVNKQSGKVMPKTSKQAQTSTKPKQDKD